MRVQVRKSNFHKKVHRTAKICPGRGALAAVLLVPGGAELGGAGLAGDLGVVRGGLGGGLGRAGARGPKGDLIVTWRLLPPEPGDAELRRVLANLQYAENLRNGANIKDEAVLQ